MMIYIIDLSDMIISLYGTKAKCNRWLHFSTVQTFLINWVTLPPTLQTIEYTKTITRFTNEIHYACQHKHNSEISWSPIQEKIRIRFTARKTCGANSISCCRCSIWYIAHWPKFCESKNKCIKIKIIGSHTWWAKAMDLKWFTLEDHWKNI